MRNLKENQNKFIKDRIKLIEDVDEIRNFFESKKEEKQMNEI